MIEPLDYRPRPDGNYLISRTCSHCKEQFDVHAMQGMQMDASDNLCPACLAVWKWEKEQQK